MSEQVGSIYYSVTLDTAEMVQGQRRVQGQLDKTTGALDAFSGKLTAVARGVSLMAAAMAAWKSANAADDMRMLGARIEVASGSMESGATAMVALEAISKRTGTTMSANADVFTRLNQSILQMGGTQADTLRITELLGKAIRVSGASAIEAKSAMLQFGQALGSGKLQGDELRSLMENAPYLMKQLADGIGVPVGALKKMGEEGKLTADVVTNALSKASAKIDADFQKFPQTISSAMDVAIDAAGRANSKLDELSGTSTALTGVTKGLGEVLDKLAEQLGAANTEAGALGRNKAIASWANETKYALSYLVDAADMVWQTVSILGRNVVYVFNGIRNEIGGIGAQVAAVMRGDFAGAKAIGDAMTQDADDRRAALDEADRNTVSRAKTAGQEMRAAWDAGAGGGRGAVNPDSATSVLTPPKSGGAGSGKSEKASAAEKYSVMLQKQIEKEQELTAVQTLGMEINSGRLGKMSAEQQNALVILAMKVDAVKAETKAQEDAAKSQEESAKMAEAYAKSQIAIEMSMAASNQAIRLHNEEIGLTKEALVALEVARIDNAIAIEEGSAALLRGQSGQEQEIATIERAIALLQEKKLLTQGGAIAQAAADSKSEMEKASKEYADTLHTDLKGAFSAAFRDTNDPLAAFGDALANVIYTRAATALADSMATSMMGSGIGSSIGSFLGFGGGRAYGGSVTSGSLYRVNEKGSPEMFTANNGSQYMMPTKSGKVTAADKVGGGGTTVINYHMNVGDVASVSMVQKAISGSERRIAGAMGRSQGYGGSLS